jgi:hypothetical protein
MARLRGGIGAMDVGDGGDGQHASAGSAGGERFGDGGHADDVGTESSHHSTFSGRFVGRSQRCQVRACEGADLVGAGGLERDRCHAMVVDLNASRHRRLIARSLPKPIDVIAEDDQVAHAALWVQTSGSIGEDHLTRAEFHEGADRAGDSRALIAFVAMQSTDHGHHALTMPRTAYQLAAMSGRGALTERADLTVGNRDGPFDCRCNRIEPTAQDDEHLRWAGKDGRKAATEFLQQWFFCGTIFSHRHGTNSGGSFPRENLRHGALLCDSKICELGNGVSYHGAKPRFGFVGNRDDLSDIRRLERVGEAHVGDDGEADDL